ncbi:MAG: polyprenyl synthetase family protein [Wenzhouxiangella sp.]
MNGEAFSRRADAIRARCERRLEAAINAAGSHDGQLCRALHYAVFNGGKRLRPLLVHASGEALDIAAERLDAAACAVELIHCYSLVHDDLPAMDDDELRRGRPTVHLAFDEATAILAGDALQALAFEMLSSDPALAGQGNVAVGMIADLARACGAGGMAGGQALDLLFEGQQPGRDELEDMYLKKTGALIRAAVVMPCHHQARPLARDRDHLTEFGECIGLAFQIRDDLLDIEGQTERIGKQRGADAARNKPTWPVLFGRDAALRRIDELTRRALDCLERIEGDTAGLEWLAGRLVEREF